MIITNNEEALRIKCEDASIEEVPEIISALELELSRSARLGRPGIGLAAPQIGIAKKVAIVRIDTVKINLINSKIVHGYDPAFFRSEGCLSFPGRYEDTIRYQEIHIEDNLSYPHGFITSGLIAVVCQHEIGHWNSDLFIDHIAPKAKPIVRSKPRPNEPCLCGSGKKFKKCCSK